MSKINITADQLAKVKHFSDGGDILANTLYMMLENEYVVALTPAAVSGGVVNIAGVVTKLDGGALTAAINVTADSFPKAGAGTLTVHASGGTVESGSASVKMWFQTNANGTFSVDVTDATAGDQVLVRFTLDNGMTEECIAQF